jgi:2',3'-cyclic-nucleotide 2'-phosphodiesterase/3'-nucleotidase
MHLRLLATTDLHAHLFPFNYYTDRRDDSVGLALLAGLIERARAECPNTLLVDNGDTLQGAPLGDAAVSDLMPEGDTHPMIAAMNGLGYDAATLGNHDFDFGLDALRRALAAARYPVILANALNAGDGSPFLPPHVLLDRTVTDAAGQAQSLRIGVTGVAPPQLAQWGHAQLAGRIEVAPMVPAAAAAARALREAGADIVVVLAHSGLGPANADPWAENVGRAIARLPGVDAVVAGHTHCTFPPGGGAAPEPGAAALVQPGANGSHLGQIDLALHRPPAGSGHWAVARATSRVVATIDAAPEAKRSLRRHLRNVPVFRDQLARGHRLTRSYAARVIGRSAVPLETYFSLCAPCAATQLIADAQRAAVAPIVARDPALADLPLLSCTTPFKAGGHGGPAYYTDIPAGALLLRHAADLYIYTNGLTLLRASGRQVRDWLERSATAFHRIDPGAPGPQPLIDHAFASYNFDRMDGLFYDIDVSRPARTNAEGRVLHDGPGRIRNLRRPDGRPVADTDSFLVVTNGYRAAGGGHYPAAASCEVVYETADPVRDRLVEYITTRRGPIAPDIVPGWSLTPLGGVEVIYETGPGATEHLARARALGLSQQGNATSGFARFMMKI